MVKLMVKQGRRCTAAATLSHTLTPRFRLTLSHSHTHPHYKLMVKLMVKQGRRCTTAASGAGSWPPTSPRPSCASTLRLASPRSCLSHLSSKVNLPYIINLRAKFGANLPVPAVVRLDPASRFAQVPSKSQSTPGILDSSPKVADVRYK